MRYSLLSAVITVMLYVILIPGLSLSQDGPYYYNQFPARGRVTMIDLGADYCVPCKMMAPILEKLKKDYAGALNVEFIDVWKNPDKAREIRIIEHIGPFPMPPIVVSRALPELLKEELKTAFLAMPKNALEPWGLLEFQEVDDAYYNPIRQAVKLGANVRLA